MKIEHGKIVSATSCELWSLWLSEEWDEVMPFSEYKNSMEKCGVIIKNSMEKCEILEPVCTDSEV